MKFDVLYNFISPVTGRILATTNYVLVGNDAGIAIPSPDLIDLKLDLINLRVDFDVASSASYIIGFSNSRLPNAQVLYSLSDGFIFNTSGVISTFSIIPIGSLPDLPMGNIWIGNDMNRPVPNPTISIDNLPNLATGNIWIGNDMNRPIPNPTISINNLPDLLMGNLFIGDSMNRPIVSKTITIDNLPDLSSGKVWIGNGSIPSRPVEGSPPQGPAGPAGPPGKGADSPNNLLNTAVGNAVSSGVKFGLEKLLGEGAKLVGYAFGGAINLVTGPGLYILGGIVGLPDRSENLRKYVDKRANDFTRNSLVGPPGAAGQAGVSTIFIRANMSLQGARIENIAPSPTADYDAVNAKWVWDLLNDNVEIIWAN